MTDAHNVSTYLTKPLRSKEEARRDLAIAQSPNVVILSSRLNALIRAADEKFVLDIDETRRHYRMLLRRLPWDRQRETREHELIVYCEERFGDLGEFIAERIICERIER